MIPNLKKCAVDTAYFFTPAAILWLAVFPLWQRGSYTQITEDKRFGMILFTVMTVVLCTGGLFQRFSSEKICFPWKPGFSRTVGLLFFGWMAVSALLGSCSGQRNSAGDLAVWAGAVRYEGMSTQLCYCCIFLFLSFGRFRLKAAADAAAGCMILFLLVVLLQYAGLCPVDFYPEGLSVFTNHEFQGTIGNIDMVSGYAVLTTAFLIGMFLLKERDGFCFAGVLAGIFLLCWIGVQSGIVALSAGFVLIGLHMLLYPPVRARGWLLSAGASACFFLRSLFLFPWETGSEGMMPAVWGKKQIGLLLFLIFSAAMAWLRCRIPGRAVPKKTVLLLLLLLLVFSIAMLYWAEIPPAREAGALWELQQIIRGERRDWFGHWRYGVWRITLQLLPDHLIFGSGPDTFHYIFNDTWAAYEAQLEADGTLERLDVHEGLKRFDNPHNEYLAVLSNCGIPALVLYLLLLGSVLYHALIPGCEKTASAPGFAVFLYMVQGFFSFSSCLVSPIFWAMLGISAAVADHSGRHSFACRP